MISLLSSRSDLLSGIRAKTSPTKISTRARYSKPRSSASSICKHFSYPNESRPTKLLATHKHWLIRRDSKRRKNFKNPTIFRIHLASSLATKPNKLPLCAAQTCRAVISCVTIDLCMFLPIEAQSIGWPGGVNHSLICLDIRSMCWTCLASLLKQTRSWLRCKAKLRSVRATTFAFKAVHLWSFCGLQTSFRVDSALHFLRRPSVKPK